MDAPEPTPVDITPGELTPDDVEAHGLKEIAVGIGAAAVLGGAGAGVSLAAAGGSTTTPASATHVVVQQAETGAAHAAKAATHAVSNAAPTPPTNSNRAGHVKLPHKVTDVTQPPVNGSDDSALSEVKGAVNDTEKAAERLAHKLATAEHSNNKSPKKLGGPGIGPIF